MASASGHAQHDLVLHRGEAALAHLIHSVPGNGPERVVHSGAVSLIELVLASVKYFTIEQSFDCHSSHVATSRVNSRHRQKLIWNRPTRTNQIPPTLRQRVLNIGCMLPPDG